MPVDTLTVRSFWQVTSETCTAPVVTVRFSASAEVCSARMSPVVVWMLAAPETAAQKTTFPVLEVISARSNVNASGSSGASGDGQGAVLRFREIDRDFRRVEIEADLGIPAAGIGGLDQQVSASTATVCFAFSAS